MEATIARRRKLVTDGNGNKSANKDNAVDSLSESNGRCTNILPQTQTESDSSTEELLPNKQLKRSQSEYGRKRKQQVLHRCNSAPEKKGAVADLVSSSRNLVESAEEFVKTVIAAGWNLVHHHHLPDWLKDNEYLLFGHRLPLNSFKACFRSVFRIHTETGNIWTHLIGMLAFVTIAVYTLSSRYIDWMWQDITVHSVFFGGAILCLTFSWLFHTVFCHSESVNKLFSKLDYCGIALLTVGSFVPFLYYSFFCHYLAHMVYLISIIVLGTSCIVVSLFDKFATPTYRPVRAGLFIALGLTGIIPTLHLCMLVGFHHAFFELGVLHLLLMACLYIGGALTYAFRFPESIFPGKFDIWCHSHQIFHICVIAAALVHFRGIQILSHTRLNVTECSPPEFTHNVNRTF